MRKILIILFTFVAIAIVIISLGELEQTWHTLQQSDLRYMLLLLTLLFLLQVIEGQTYKSLYHLMDMKESLRHLILLASASNFINVVAPSGGFGGVAIFVDDAGKRGNPRGLTAAVGALHIFLEYLAFMVMLALGWVVFIRRNDLQAGEITASIIMFCTMIGMTILIYIGSRSGEQLGKVLGWMAHKANAILWPFIHREYFHEIAAHEFGIEISEGLSMLHLKKRSTMVPFLLSLGVKCIQVTIMAVAFLAFAVPFTLGTIVAAFASAYLFLVVSPTPYGIGFVETLLPLALTSLGVGWENAVIVTLTYRSFTFWFPLLLGGISFRLLQRE